MLPFENIVNFITKVDSNSKDENKANFTTGQILSYEELINLKDTVEFIPLFIFETDKKRMVSLLRRLGYRNVVDYNVPCMNLSHIPTVGLDLLRHLERVGYTETHFLKGIVSKHHDILLVIPLCIEDSESFDIFLKWQENNSDLQYVLAVGQLTSLVNNIRNIVPNAYLLADVPRSIISLRDWLEIV